MGEMMSAGGMHAGKPLGKPRGEINHNFITDFRETAFESAESILKAGFFLIETLAFTFCVLHARDSVKVSSDTFTWIWNKYLWHTVRYILHRR